MNEALRIYLDSTMSQEDKIAAIRLQFLACAVFLDANTGSSIVQEWMSDEVTVMSDDLAIESAFFKAGWL